MRHLGLGSAKLLATAVISSRLDYCNSLLYDLLMLRQCFINFAVEHRFGCHAIEPGFARDIGNIEVCFID